MEKRLREFFKQNPSGSYKSKQLQRKFGLRDDADYAELKSKLYQLYEEGFLAKNGKKYSLFNDGDKNKIKGEIEINNAGYGFLLPSKKNVPDVFVAERNIGCAFHGDIVEVTLFAKQKGRNRGKNLEGQVTRIIKRKWQEITGTLRKSNNFYVVVPDIPEIAKDIYISADSLQGAKIGEKVIVGDIVWDNPKLNPEGKIQEVLGKKGRPEVELIGIAKEFKLPYKFPKKVQEEADAIPVDIPPSTLKGRADFRKKNVFTIDPDDAKDFDDALHIEQLDNGNFEVGIHIADVANYVKPGSALDSEAFKRGNSVYLVGAVIPMLPEKLSNGICSLVPNEDRLAFSVVAELTPRCKVVSYRITKSVINSKRRFTYAEAQQVIETGKGDLADEIVQLNKFALVLRRKRKRDGSIDFFTQEVKFVLDDDGKPIKAAPYIIQDSNRLVEEYMLLANKLVASHIADRPKQERKPLVYRIHDKPDTEKMQELARFSKSLGYQVKFGASPTPQQINTLMEAARGNAEETLINELAIRSMAKAIYSEKNIGHFGLGFKNYSHFTSPIRRYADLLVHRIILADLTEAKKVMYSEKELNERSEHISFTERNALDAERLSVKLKHIEYLEPFVGHEFDALISGVTNFGIFVKLLSTLAEGLIHVRDLEGDYYTFDEKKYSLIGTHSKREYRLGDRIRVKLVRIDTEKSLLDFIIAS